MFLFTHQLGEIAFAIAKPRHPEFAIIGFVNGVRRMQKFNARAL